MQVLLQGTCPQIRRTYKTIYLFEFQIGGEKIMIRMLEAVGIILVIVMFLSFVGVLRPSVEPGLSSLFWVCAGGTLMIILYRKMKRSS